MDKLHNEADSKPAPRAPSQHAARLSAGLRTAGYTTVFALFMVPVVYNELSLNYSYVLLPLVLSLATGRLSRPPRLFVVAIAVFSLVFLASFLGQFDLYVHTLRRTVSFGLFLAYFSYVALPLDVEMTRAFKLSVIGIGLVYAVGVTTTYFSLGGAALSFSAKDLVGDQRFGFIYLLGGWMVYFYRPRRVLLLVSKYGVLAILLAGLLLTFSRGAIIALLGSVILFAVVRNGRWLFRPSVGGLRVAAFSMIAVVGVAVFLQMFLPTAFDFFAERLFRLESAKKELANPEASAGVRMEIAKLIVDYVADHPLTGSGYLGLWTLPARPADANSAHNQYTDVLLRTGLAGFAMFLFLLYRLMRFLSAKEPALFWGFASILIMCLFHDIFKESEGAFVLAFGFGLLAQHLRSRKSVSTVP